MATTKLLKIANHGEAAHRRLEDFPAWVEAQERLVTLKLRMGAIEGKVGDLLGRMAGLVNDTARGERSLEAQARRLAAGEVVGPQAESVHLSALSDEMARENQNRAVLTRAISILEQDINALRIQLSIEICADVAPAYRKLVAEQVGLVRAVAEGNDKIFEFLESLSDQGISSRILRPMQFSRAGRLSDDQSIANIYLRDAKEHGFI